MAAKKGEVILNNAYGFNVYDNNEGIKQKITTNTLYDLASVTKTSATTVAIMKLYEEGKIDLYKTLSFYLPYTKNTSKANLKIKDILLHQAGLVPFIPFYKSVIDSITGKPKAEWFNQDKKDAYTTKIAKNIFLHTAYRDSIIKKILESPVASNSTYVYSDNDFIFLGEIVKHITGKPLDMYCEETFYKPLKMASTTFTPLEKGIQLKDIAPTEYEKHFREQLIWGHVHDEGAAMLGGVAGHAGLFSNATDLSKLYLMLLNNGSYNGVQYLKPETINLFTSYQSSLSRRGLGFDKPEKDNTTNKDPYPSKYSSQKTFGHTGFTGICVWADPENNLLFIFLSNRVHPTRENNKLSLLGVRRKVLDELYKETSH